MLLMLLGSESNIITAQAMAAAISAGVSILISAVSGIVTTRKAMMNFYSSTVSKERVSWINQTREIASKLIAFCSAHTEDCLSSKDMSTFEEMRSALIMRLCPKEYIGNKDQYAETDGVLIDLLDREYAKVRDNRYEIRRVVTLLCKIEWNRIKAEAGGSKNIEKKIKKYDESQARNNNQ